MLRGIIAYRNRIPKFLLAFIGFIPIALTATYLVLVATIVLPVAIAVAVVVSPLLYAIWCFKTSKMHPIFMRLTYPFEMIGLTIVNAPKIAAAIVHKTKNIGRPVIISTKTGIHRVNVKLPRNTTLVWVLRALAILGIVGIALYLVAVAAVVLPLAMACCILVAPFCYLTWYVKEKKYRPLFHKIPGYFEHLGFTIVNSRKIMTNIVVSIKNIKWPMF